MNKLAQYLNQHLQGEVLTDKGTRDRFAVDNGPLRLEPEMVVCPLETNDIRKLLRFSWQLAEKGHKLPVVVRGSGTNGTSASVSDGVVVATDVHMNQVFEYDMKQRLVRLQPGVRSSDLANALRLQGVSVPSLGRGSHTAGGVLADMNGSFLSSSVEQIEVVLANGDVVQTKRLSKRELDKAKGKIGLEADIYREIDALIEDNTELIEQFDDHQSQGYYALARVKDKDGSFDLSPLFLGSQGTLGVISEMILRTEYMSENTSMVVGAFADPASARDALDGVMNIEVASLEYYDAGLVKAAMAQGKEFSFIGEAEEPTLLVFRIDDLSGRAQARKVKKLTKLLEKAGAHVTTTDDFERSELRSVDSILLLAGRDEDKIAQKVVDDVYVPLERSEDFMSEIAEIEKKCKIKLPLYGYPHDSLWTVRPIVDMKTVGGKRTLLKFIKLYDELVRRCGGYLHGSYGEGRLQIVAPSSSEDEAVAELFAKVKEIFDPHSVLNPGVKQAADVKEVVKLLRSESSRLM